MPFTLSHPAAVIPLAKLLGRRAVLSALVIGSMMPDMAYFLALDVEREYSHSVVGLFTYCLPLGLVMYWVFHMVLKAPLIALVGSPLQARLSITYTNYKQLPKAGWSAVVFSMLLGATTHLIWDAFTHGFGPAVEAFPELRIVLFNVYGIHVPVFKLLQHVSTLVGLLLVVYWIAQWFRHTQPHPIAPSERLRTRHVLATWIGMLLLPMSVGLLVGLYGLAEYQPASWLHVIPKEVVLAVLPVWVAYLITYSVCWHSGWLKVLPTKEKQKI